MLCSIAITLLFFGGISGYFFSGSLAWVAPAHIVLALILLVIYFLQKHKQDQEKRQQQHFWNRRRQSLTLVCFSVLLCVLLNILVFRHDHVWDFTESRIHLLSEQTEDILRTFPHPVHVIVWHSSKSVSGYKDEKLLRKYQERASSKFSFEFLDPVREPRRFAQARLQEGDRAILQTKVKGEARELRLQSLREEALSGALLALMQDARKKVYVIQGHREPSLDSAEPFGLSSFAQDLLRENIEVEKLLLAGQDAIPSDAHSVLLISPKDMLLPEEQTLLQRYLEEGGNMLVFADPGSADLPFLQHFGVRVRPDIVVDNGEKGFGAQLAITRIARHALTEKLLRGGRGESAIVMTMASSLALDTEQMEKLQLKSQVLLETSEKAWGEQDFQAALARKPVRQDEFEASGRLAVAAVVEGKGKLLVFGDSDWILNGNRHWYANRDLSMNALHWALGETSALGLRPRHLRASREQLSDQQLFLMGLLTFLVCELLVLTGLWIAFRRRHAKLIVEPSFSSAS